MAEHAWDAILDLNPQAGENVNILCIVTCSVVSPPRRRVYFQMSEMSVNTC